MSLKPILCLLAGTLELFAAGGLTSPVVADKPPMGWNSYDCLGYTVTEEQVKTVADYMAQHLKSCGWDYVVIDWCWYAPSTGSKWPPNQNEHFEPPLAMDAYGRLIPSLDRFPSAAEGKGFKPLADYVHGKGLKFGIHIIRGIPRQAVARKTPVLGSTATAADIAWIGSSWGNPNCTWGIRMDQPGAQEYLDSVFKLYAQWGVDFVKIDDLTQQYYQAEIEGYRKAIDRCGRPMVFSGSPGATPLEQAAHVSRQLNMWRLLEDLWDNWKQVDHAFEVIPQWLPYAAPGHWPDPDMLPLGRVMDIGQSRLNHDEQRTLMTLWCITRCPLILGGYLPDNDAFTTSLITNTEVLAVDQEPARCSVLRSGELPVFVATRTGARDQYVALFNRSDRNLADVTINLREVGVQQCRVRDLWAQQDLGEFSGTFTAAIPAHGSGLFRLTVVEAALDAATKP
ncbi:MAG TPA: glycoside hydrolase family 27 protein [Verrucomicrobiae bacterium]|nr:glycoside hydrolase family 27 protein [Verrucomicrobiae bacterium]